MERILVNGFAELRATFYISGIATDPSPDSATVTVTRADGTVVATAASATPIPASPPTVPEGTFGYQLAAATNNRLDRLTFAWSSALGQINTNADVVGGFLISSAEMIELYPNDTSAKLSQRRIDIETRLEEACGRAFVPRYERERVTMDRRGRLRLKWGSLRSILTVSTDLTTLTTDQIANLTLNHEAGLVWGVPSGVRSREVTISYYHGADYPTETARSAAMAAVEETYGPNRIDGRVRTKSVDNVSVTYASDGSTSTSYSEFTSPDVVTFIRNNRRPLVG